MSCWSLATAIWQALQSPSIIRTTWQTLTWLALGTRCHKNICQSPVRRPKVPFCARSDLPPISAHSVQNVAGVCSVCLATARFASGYAAQCFQDRLWAATLCHHLGPAPCVCRKLPETRTAHSLRSVQAVILCAQRDECLLLMNLLNMRWVGWTLGLGCIIALGTAMVWFQTP